MAAPGSPGRSQIALQVWLGLAALMVIIGATVIVALAVIVSLNRNEATFSDRSVPYAQAVDDAALNAKSVSNDERGFLITGDRGFVSEARSRARRAEAAFAAGLAAASGATRRRALADARQEFELWLTHVRREFATYDAGDRRQAIETSMGAGRVLRKRYEASPQPRDAARERRDPQRGSQHRLRVNALDRDPDRLPPAGARHGRRDSDVARAVDHAARFAARLGAERGGHRRRLSARRGPRRNRVAGAALLRHCPDALDPRR